MRDPQVVRRDVCAAVASTDPLLLAMIAFGAGLGLMLAAFGIGFMVYRRRKRRET